MATANAVSPNLDSYIKYFNDHIKSSLVDESKKCEYLDRMLTATVNARFNVVNALAANNTDYAKFIESDAISVEANFKWLVNNLHDINRDLLVQRYRTAAVKARIDADKARIDADKDRTDADKVRNHTFRDNVARTAEASLNLILDVFNIAAGGGRSSKNSKKCSTLRRRSSVRKTRKINRLRKY
jgi:hypothetical protein